MCACGVHWGFGVATPRAVALCVVVLDGLRFVTRPRGYSDDLSLFCSINWVWENENSNRKDVAEL